MMWNAFSSVLAQIFFNCRGDLLKQPIFCLTLALVVLSFATVATAAGIKIGYVDTARLLEQAPQAKSATSKLKEEFAPREEELRRIQKELKQMEDRLSRDSAIMSDAERKKIGLDVLARKRAIRRKQDEFREDINLRRNEALGTLQQMIKQAIQDVGKAGQYDLILYDGIAFANSALDITNVVLDVLKKLKPVVKNK